MFWVFTEWLEAQYGAALKRLDESFRLLLVAEAAKRKKRLPN